jgi:beta-alanine degradation protein BauB
LIPQFEHEGVANACEFWNQGHEAGTGTTMIRAKSDVQIDNPEVRVTEWRLTPGSATGHHIHEMDYVIVPVIPGEMTIVEPNGERSKAQLGLGKSYFRKAGVEHDVLNETASEIVFLEVELKP